ncbi:hypothetical protein [Sphingobium phenoxybenzoativorans]|uniref:hypothetical protein n=1 Tax=Sphingobium phenoxybenzoativorans TaxID=1592790 RepID=UPI0008729106|nr:hypothetical protein [Sphingobium phenoxybenzoativorans]
MKHATFAESGGPGVLKVAPINLPAPGAGEVRVAIEAIGLNRFEALYRKFLYHTRCIAIGHGRRGCRHDH